MASITIRSAIITITILFLNLAGSSGGSRLIGGRSEIGDVRMNKEVQELGRFSVEEYNRIMRSNSSSSDRLRFLEVLAAEKQVVSGIKYFLTVAAASENGDGEIAKIRNFECVVVVKPWLNSKKLLGFVPSSDDDDHDDEAFFAV